MAHAFSVYVNIGGKLNPSLPGAVNAAKAQVKGLEATLAGIGARINAPFIAVQRHIDATAKKLEKVQQRGARLTMGVTAPSAFVGVNWLKQAAGFEGALNTAEALGDLPAAHRGGLEKIAQDLAKRYDAGGATGIVKTTTELMKAGLSFEQAKGSLEQVLAASALAGDMTPADVGASLSKSLAQFQMPVANLAQVTKSSQLVTDRMTYAAVSTVASMKDISESFKYVGGVMSATGNSLDASTAIIMSFAKAGVLGSEAGVALRSALVRLVKMPKGGLAALERIGMNLGDYTSARPVTGKAVVGGLQAGGIDASKIEGEIDRIINSNAGRGPVALGAAITKAVQSHLGDSSVVGADTIAESVNAAITAAGSKVDVTKFFNDLKAKFDSGTATMGDIAQILEARHISRYMALLKDDLPALIAKIVNEAEGYAQERYKTKQKGLPAELTRLAASYDQFHTSIVKSVAPEISSMLERIAESLERLGKSSPGVLRLGVGIAAAAAAAGPLMFAFGALGRIGTLALTALLAPVGMLARGIAGLGVAVAGLATAGAARLGAMAVGLRMLTALGAGATLSALAGSLGRLALAPFLLIATGLRSIGAAMLFIVANPVGLIIAGLVAALAALGAWVYNNWNGIKQFFAGLGDGFMKGLGPAGGAIKSMADGIGSIVNWLGQMLGPLDASGSKWRSWGETVGGVVASGVQLVVSGVEKLIGLLGSLITKAGEVGSAIANMFRSSPGAGAAKAPFVGNSIAGARAMGGPVSYGKPYLVGERGPELFVPGATGRIETNHTLRRLTADGASALAGSTTNNTMNRGPVSFNPVFNISGDDPRGIGEQVRGEMRRFLAELESDQSSYLSD